MYQDSATTQTTVANAVPHKNDNCDGGWFIGYFGNGPGSNTGCNMARLLEVGPTNAVFLMVKKNTSSLMLNSYSYVRRSLVLSVVVVLLPLKASAQSVIHPTKENIPVSADPRFELGHDDNEEVWSWDMMEVTTVGVNEGNAHEMIGWLIDFDVDHNGTMYYVDLMGAQVRAYGYDGKFIADVSTAGIGPGEFRDPAGLAVLEGGRKIIVDDVYVDHVFQREGDTFNLIATNQPEYLAQQAFCAMNGYYYNQRYVDKQHEGVILRYTLEGNWENSFAKPYDYENQFIVSRITADAMLACNAKHGVVAQIINHIPAMTGYSEDGEELWQVTFSDYRSDTILESVRGWDDWFALFRLRTVRQCLNHSFLMEIIST